MLRTGAQYRDGLRDGRGVAIDGERVKDVNAHPALRPIVGIRDGSRRQLETYRLNAHRMRHRACMRCKTEVDP